MCHLNPKSPQISGLGVIRQLTGCCPPRGAYPLIGFRMATSDSADLRSRCAERTIDGHSSRQNGPTSTLTSATIISPRPAIRVRSQSGDPILKVLPVAPFSSEHQPPVSCARAFVVVRNRGYLRSLPATTGPWFTIGTDAMRIASVQSRLRRSTLVA